MVFVSVCAGKWAKSGKNPKKHPFPTKFREKEKGVYSRPDTSEKKAEVGRICRQWRHLIESRLALST